MLVLNILGRCLFIYVSIHIYCVVVYIYILMYMSSKARRPAQHSEQNPNKNAVQGRSSHIKDIKFLIFSFKWTLPCRVNSQKLFFKKKTYFFSILIAFDGIIVQPHNLFFTFLVHIAAAASGTISEIGSRVGHFRNSNLGITIVNAIVFVKFDAVECESMTKKGRRGGVILYYYHLLFLIFIF